MLVNLSTQREEELIKLITGTKLPLQTEDLEKLMTLSTDWGVKTKEKEIYKIIYG